MSNTRRTSDGGGVYGGRVVGWMVVGRRARGANGNEDEGRLGLTARRARRERRTSDGGSTRTRRRALSGRRRRCVVLHTGNGNTGVKYYYYCAPQRHLSRPIRVPRRSPSAARDSRLFNDCCAGGGPPCTLHYSAFIINTRDRVCVCFSTDKTYRGRTAHMRRRWPFIHYSYRPWTLKVVLFFFTFLSHAPRGPPAGRQLPRRDDGDNNIIIIIVFVVKHYNIIIVARNHNRPFVCLEVRSLHSLLLFRLRSRRANCARRVARLVCVTLAHFTLARGRRGSIERRTPSSVNSSVHARFRTSGGFQVRPRLLDEHPASLRKVFLGNIRI